MTNTEGYSNRANAKRAAEKMIGNGTAPAVDYGIKEGDDGRFEIVWKTGVKPPNAPTTDEVETEIAEAALQAAPAATEAAQPGAAPPAAAEAEAALQPAPAAPIGAESESSPQGDHDPELAAVEIERLISELARRGYRATQARQARAERLARERQPSKAKLIDDAAARGVMPDKPDVTSHANKHYQKRFDKLAELASADDWDAVAGYECNGVNSYAKMVRQYRDRLVTAHKAQQVAATATEQGAAQ